MSIQPERHLSAEAIGRQATFTPGTILPSESLISPYSAISLQAEQLSTDGGNTRRVGNTYQRFDGNAWRQVS